MCLNTKARRCGSMEWAAWPSIQCRNLAQCRSTGEEKLRLLFFSHVFLHSPSRGLASKERKKWPFHHFKKWPFHHHPRLNVVTEKSWAFYRWQSITWWNAMPFNDNDRGVISSIMGFGLGEGRWLALLIGGHLPLVILVTANGPLVIDLEIRQNDH